MIKSIKEFRDRAKKLFGESVHLVSEVWPFKYEGLEDYCNNLFYIEQEGKNKVFILSGVHDTERNAPELILEYLYEKKPKSGFLFYPILNFGFSSDNYRVEMEHNYFTHRFLRVAPETYIFMRFLFRKRSFDYFIDVHEYEEKKGIVYKIIANDNDPLSQKIPCSTYRVYHDSIDYVYREYGKSSFLVELPSQNKMKFLKSVLDCFFKDF